MQPAARCSIPTDGVLKSIELACKSGIRQLAATRQAVILSLSVAVDVVAFMLPGKAATVLREEGHRHLLTWLYKLAGRTPL